ncbi:hypothetical protein FGO68_gene1118 [Halteria grandinella]|uniref:Uncharacterized protein n=1 Tax=Halteria grandinella TaxID=5974 RepID=A0A8J8NA60_HALGN|nr:hypothetical protein FGO68_gene1118 [Halteria grandinella]
MQWLKNWVGAKYVGQTRHIMPSLEKRSSAGPFRWCLFLCHFGMPTVSCFLNIDIPGKKIVTIAMIIRVE